jgi:hypothetical protein
MIMKDVRFALAITAILCATALTQEAEQHFRLHDKNLEMDGRT